MLYEITIFSGTGRTKHAKAQAEVARRAAETDLFMELRLLNLVGDKNDGNLDDPDKKRKILQWAKVKKLFFKIISNTFQVITNH